MKGIDAIMPHARSIIHELLRLKKLQINAQRTQTTATNLLLRFNQCVNRNKLQLYGGWSIKKDAY